MSNGSGDPNDNNIYDLWQSSYDKAVCTEDLIKSFGWSGGDAFVQHDVQEFLRVLMDKIESKVVGTPAEKIVEKLFSGEYQSYVSCKNVEYESVRNENFQDIQLTIPKNMNNHRNNSRRGYNRYSGGSDALANAPDIYDCIRKFIEPETLDGNNQYYANDELKKQDADKGLRFTKFPPVLFLQLCRFEIDHYQHTSKINDPVKFYQDIDLNPFVYVEEKEGEHVKGNKQAPNKYYNHMEMDMDGCGEFSYQLFSVLVHSGSTYGGHYFAYINPGGESGGWYKFDDENVSVVGGEEATVKQFGGSSRQSAYMLVYIQKKYAKQVLQEVQEGDIPLELRKYFSKEKEERQEKRREELENRKKCKISYVNGHDFCDDEGNVNVLDMGMKQLLNNKKIYKDIRFKEIFADWSVESHIALDDLMVWNYTERKNKSLRTNREIKLDLNEEYQSDEEKEYSADDIKRHKIKTNPTQKHPKSIHDRIGNLLEKKRMFILLDKSKINTLENKSIDSKTKTILIALKYFDFFTQKLYFVDWLLIKTMSVTFGDIISYVENKLIPNTKDKRRYFETLFDYNIKINEYELQNNLQSNNKYFLFEEECVLKNKGSRDDYVCKVGDVLDVNEKICEDYYNGDIFVFQLNPYHPYFNALQIENKCMEEIMNDHQNENGDKKSLSLSIKLLKHDFQQRGVYWYRYVGSFIQSQLNMTCIELKVRENTGWKQQWTKALILQYKNQNKIDIIDKEIRKKIIKSRHKWFVEKKSTYGMIRRKLGAYYNINPLHIEIWLPQNSYSYGNNKWDYGSQGRGKWNIKLDKLLSSGRQEWNEICNLKFEIQTYNVCDFDQMTLYDDSNSNSYSYYNRQNNNNNNNKFSKRIKELAMFNFDIIAPNKPTSNSGNMTMSFNKNWTAEILIQHILKEVIENPIFGYTFFSNIIKYIREERGDNNNDDITILKSLSAERFLVCDENDNKVPGEYFMTKKYKMPGQFSQIKYTDFRIQFLAKNDPLVMNFNSRNKNEDIESKNDEMEVDSDNIEIEIENNENENNKQETRALWVYFKKTPSYSNNKIYQRIRIVLQNGESLKDVIMKYLKPYLKISNISPSSSKQSSVDKDEKDNKEEKSEEDKLFEQIVETHKFVLKGAANSNPVLNKVHLETVKIFESLLPKMYLIVQMPASKKKYTSNYDKPLTIID